MSGGLDPRQMPLGELVRLASFQIVTLLAKAKGERNEEDAEQLDRIGQEIDKWQRKEPGAMSDSELRTLCLEFLDLREG